MAEATTIITSVCGAYRAKIVQRPAGGFQVTIYRWTTDEYVPPFWEDVSTSVRIADTLERATELVEEEFRSLGTTGPAPAEEN